MTRFIFITGGVVSSLGKGIASASLGALLQARGFKVRLRKLDPYLNVDPGTMSPYQHGEVYVTDDGAETDLDLGHYERFTGVASHSSDVPSFFLYMTVLVLMAYTSFYIYMKQFVHGEKPMPIAVVAFVVGMAFAIPAVWVFSQHLISYSGDAAESRAHNEPCMMFDFFDSHDLWHILSSFGLFFICLSNLHLDDDLAVVRRDRIPVF